VKTIPDPGFAGDDGSADPAVVAAVAAAASDPAQLPELLAALHRARVLAPVVAMLGESETTAGGLVREKSADIAVPVLIDPDGARALPVFTDLAAMARWDPAARPVPVDGPRAAQVALQERAEAIVVDVAGPQPATLPLAELRALAEGRGSLPAWRDAQLMAEIARLLEQEPDASAASLDPAAGHDARLTVRIDPAADAATVAARLADGVAGLPSVQRGVRGLEVRVTRGGS
jgi:hypothetical protein